MDPTIAAIKRELGFNKSKTASKAIDISSVKSIAGIDTKYQVSPEVGTPVYPNIVSDSALRNLHIYQQEFGRVFKGLSHRDEIQIRRMYNPFENIYTAGRGTKRASTKLINIEGVLNVLDLDAKANDRSEFRFFDLCGAPGEMSRFIANVCIERSIGYIGYGMSLRDVDNSELSWDLSGIKDFNVLWGKDGTGNLCNVENIKSIVNDKAISSKKVNFVIADGGFDVEGESQEISHSKLILAEIITAIQILAKGGNLVLKTFELYTGVSLDMVTILATHFDTIYIFKPLTSRPGNSERYVICKGFRDNIYQQDVADLYHSITSTRSIRRLLKGTNKSVESYLTAINNELIVRQIRYIKLAIVAAELYKTGKTSMGSDESYNLSLCKDLWKMDVTTTPVIDMNTNDGSHTAVPTFDVNIGSLSDPIWSPRDEMIFIAKFTDYTKAITDIIVEAVAGISHVSYEEWYRDLLVEWLIYDSRNSGNARILEYNALYDWRSLLEVLKAMLENHGGPDIESNVLDILLDLENKLASTSRKILDKWSSFQPSDTDVLNLEVVRYYGMELKGDIKYRICGSMVTITKERFAANTIPFSGKVLFKMLSAKEYERLKSLVDPKSDANSAMIPVLLNSKTFLARAYCILLRETLAYHNLDDPKPEHISVIKNGLGISRARLVPTFVYNQLYGENWNFTDTYRGVTTRAAKSYTCMYNTKLGSKPLYGKISGDICYSSCPKKISKDWILIYQMFTRLEISDIMTKLRTGNTFVVTIPTRYGNSEVYTEVSSLLSSFGAKRYNLENTIYKDSITYDNSIRANYICSVFILSTENITLDTIKMREDFSLQEASALDLILERENFYVDCLNPFRQSVMDYIRGCHAIPPSQSYENKLIKYFTESYLYSLAKDGTGSSGIIPRVFTLESKGYAYLSNDCGKDLVLAPDVENKMSNLVEILNKQLAKYDNVSAVIPNISKKIIKGKPYILFYLTRFVRRYDDRTIEEQKSSTKSSRISLPVILESKYRKLRENFKAIDSRFTEYVAITLLRYGFIGASSYRGPDTILYSNIIKSVTVSDDILMAMNVEYEVFGSPFSKAAKGWYSIFHDSDKMFGSKGSAYSVTYNQGTYLLIPIRNESIINMSLKHMERSMSMAKGPVIVWILIPDWYNYKPQNINEIYRETFDDGTLTLLDSFTDERDRIAKTTLLVVSNKMPKLKSQIEEVRNIWINMQ